MRYELPTIAMFNIKDCSNAFILRSILKNKPNSPLEKYGTLEHNHVLSAAFQVNKVFYSLKDGNGNFASGAVANLVDEMGGALVHVEGLPMNVSVDMSISYLSTAKLDDELEIVSKLLGKKGGYSGTLVLVRNKTTGELIAEGRHSLFDLSKHKSKAWMLAATATTLTRKVRNVTETAIRRILDRAVMKGITNIPGLHIGSRTGSEGSDINDNEERGFRSHISCITDFSCKIGSNKRPICVRASSNDARSISSSGGPFRDGGEFQEPSALEFITSERVKVVMMLALALALCNADRVVMSVAIVPLSLSNGWRQSFAGVVQSSFLWGYLISPIAGGTLVDYYGGKVVMAWGVALWSLATFLTPWAAESSLWALLAMRMLLGIAEGVALPCMNNMIARWFPQTERARAVGLAMAGFQLGSAIGLTLSPILMSQGGIYGPFVIFGLSGFLWVLVWVSATSSTPERSRQISMYELQYIQNTGQIRSVIDNKVKTNKVVPPFNRLLAKLPTWSIIVANAMHSWGFFVILSWMPIYFKTIYHVDLRQAAWFSAVPWSMMALSGYFAGVLSDLMIERGISVTLTRKIMQSIGFIGPGIALIGLTMARTPALASAWLTLAVGLKAFSHCGFLVNLQEIAPQYSGVLHGLSNTAGTFAAIIGTVGAGYFVELIGSFKGFLLLTSFLYFSASLFWNLFATGERMKKRTPSPLISSNRPISDTEKSKSALDYIKAATQRVFSALFFWKKQVKSKLNEAEAGRGLHARQVSSTSNSLGTSSTRSTSKSSSRTKDSDSRGSKDTIIHLGSVEISLDEICKATGNFSSANKIGEGAFGTVYKAKLKDGSFVAVKRAKKLIESFWQDKYDKRLSTEFKNEIRALSKIEHQNLVRFHGYIEHGDERLIIVEYVPNGTLREHLDGMRGELEIAERVEIAIDVAHAITYLHTYSDPPIIHRDIKASNILITERFRAKVADFGFARLAVEDPSATHISTQVKGTAGYLDPEYLKTYQLTEKSDVYSFGVLLVEMMTGRHPIEQRKNLDERITIRWAMKKLKAGEAVITMDPRLRRNPASNEAVEKVLKLARQCLAPSRQSRPTMKKCAEILWEIRKELREKSLVLHAASYHSGNVTEGGVRRNRQDLYGIADIDYYKFYSA
ncbi:hypothetical protein M9H77_06001 [Catharanthus roseus]|uniref:Uncharacterized protein n=1 Tax=Catharanthus roseus TaxID=4058 RepID=A0ACC0BQX6_CATRO|nr:hypothetical protein M9H77_06001 [Catharanthus roseus]